MNLMGFHPLVTWTARNGQSQRPEIMGGNKLRKRSAVHFGKPLGGSLPDDGQVADQQPSLVPEHFGVHDATTAAELVLGAKLGGVEKFATHLLHFGQTGHLHPHLQALAVDSELVNVGTK